MEFLTDMLDSTSFPVLAALILGLMTAISPCPLATNITAIGFISKDIENRNRVFYNGLVYTLGRTLSYTVLAIVLFYGADQFRISGLFQQYGEKFIGPLMIMIGLLMLDVFTLRIPGFNALTEKFSKKGTSNYWDVLLLGIVFALAFCPYSGVLYFGMLIPMTISSGNAIILPVAFALATGIPVIVFAWLIAFALSNLGVFYNSVKVFEKWFRRAVAVLFIAFGIYYIYIIYLH
jgi:sulfite exporter TauE/SafE